MSSALQFGVGFRYYKGAYREFRLARTATLDTLVAIEGSLVGILAFTEEIKAESGEIVTVLQDRGIEVVLLTGDHAEVAQKVAEKLKITTVHAGMNPEGKLAIR